MREVYISHDGPRLFSCRNRAGTTYFGLFVDEDEAAEIYLFVPVSERRFAEVRSGRVPLRAAFTQPLDGWTYLVRFGLRDPDEQVEAIKPEEISQDWLPDHDAHLAYETPTAPELDRAEVQGEAHEAFSSVAVFELDTPYRTTEYSLRELGTIMHLVQDNMDALGQVVQDKQTSRGAVQQDVLEAAQLDFQRVRAASFAFMVRPTAISLIEHPQVQGSLSLLLSMLGAGGDDAALRQALAPLKGRALAKYRDLLEAMEDADTGMNLIVADPMGDARESRLSRDAVARSLALVRSSLDETATRRFTVEGLLVGVNVRTHSFEIYDDTHEKKYSGRVDKPARARLVGLTTHQRYEFALLEQVEVQPVTGAEHFKYRLEAIWAPGERPADETSDETNLSLEVDPGLAPPT